MSEKTILLAEDDEAHVELFRRALAYSGIPCRLDVVHDGTEVIDYLFVPQGPGRAPREMPDLILLDLKMPRIGGLQVLQMLRRVRNEDRTQLPPIVVLSSSDLDHDIVEAYRLGARSYICKPLDFDKFADAVNETVRYWLHLNQPAPANHRSMEFVPEGL